MCHNRTTHDGCSWCAECTGVWQGDLGFIAAHWTELALAETRQVRFMSRGGRRGSQTGLALPFNASAQDCREQARAVLTGWADVLGAPQIEDVRRLTRWLSDHAALARAHSAAEDIWREIHQLARQFIHAIDRPEDREYLGECVSDSCTGKGYALTCVRGSTSARCQHCGTIYDASATRHQRLLWSDDQLVTQAELSRVYPKQTIGRWIKSGALLSCGTRNGRPTYRLGDARTLRGRSRES
jgi:hypothetical protein